MQPWIFGERALPEQERFAYEVRELCSAVLGIENAEPALDTVIQAIAQASARLTGPADLRPRVGPLTEGRVYLDHGRDSGGFNPMFPVYEIDVAGPERATGTVCFPLCYEGPPGCVHGGFLAVFADCVVQHHNCAVGLSGKTRGLEVRYRRPVPLHSELTFEIVRTVEDGSVRSDLRLTRNGELLCTAALSAVAADRTAMPAVSPRRAP